MREFTYVMGEFKPGNGLTEGLAGENIDDYAKRLGFTYKYREFSEPGYYDPQLEIYENPENGTFYLLVSLSSSGGCPEIFIPDYPNLLHFLANYGQAILVAQQNTVLKDLSRMIDKLLDKANAIR